MVLLYYENTYQKKFDVSVTVQTRDINQSLTFNDDNLNLLQRVEIPTLPTNVSLSMAGSGCALFQVSSNSNFILVKILTMLLL